FRAAGAVPGGCALGSVKTNIGHTHAAAGVAGLIKTVLALRHGLIPPSLHHDRPNTEIDFAAGPFTVAREPREWPRRDGPRRAGVSSFGMGGTGAHVVLEEAPPVDAPAGPSGVRVLRLSARTERALEEQTDRIAAHLATHPGADLAAVEHTLSRGRRAFAHRRTVVAADSAEAAESLAARDPRAVRTGGPVPPSRPSVAFLIPGVGDQNRGLGHGLYTTRPAFRAAVDECADLLKPLLGRDIRDLLYPVSGKTAEASGPDLRAMLGRRPSAPAGPGEPAELLRRTRYAQPAAFVTGYALARLWEAHGVRPDALIGYSLGEYVAACLAGVFTLPDALRLVARRAELIDGLPPGAMLAVPMAEADAAAYLTRDVRVAAVNGPNLCVLGGPADAVAEVEARLAEAR
ncbi:acyltransferase domain-containing protein, partial [Spirillospora sp. NPDC049652]